MIDRLRCSAGIAVGLFDTSTLNFIRPRGYPYTCKHNLGQAEKETSLRRADFSSR